MRKPVCQCRKRLISFFTLLAILLINSFHLVYGVSDTFSNKHEPEIDSIIQQGKDYLDEQKYELALVNFEKSLNLAEKKRYDTGIVQSEFHIGTVYRLQGNNLQAIDAYRAALNLYSKSKDSLGIANSYNSLGLIYTNTGEYSEALDYLIKSIGIFKRQKNLLEESNVLLNIGRLYSHIGDLDKALEFTSSSLTIKRKLNNQGGIANCLNNLGVIYRRKGDLDRALGMFEESLSIQRTLGDKTGIANSLNNIGIILHSRNQSAQAIRYFKESLAIREELGDKSGIALGLYNLGYMYSVINNNRSAVEYFNRSIEYSGVINDNNLRLRGYEALSEQYQKTGEYKNALAYFEMFHQLHDSLFNERSKNQLLEIQAKYESAEKERELIKTRQISLALGGLLILALTFFIAVFFSYRRNKRINFKLSKQNKEIKIQKRKLEETKEKLQKNLKLKELFFAAANHELRVPLSIILGFTELLSNRIDDKNLLKYIDQIKSNSKSLQKLVEDILDFSNIENDHFRLEKEPLNILLLSRDIIGIFEQKLSGKPIQFKVEQNSSLDKWLLLDEVRIRQIIYNLMDNAMKFTGEGEINLSLNIDSENDSDSDSDTYTLTIIIQDTGIGIPEECQQLIFSSNYKTKPVTDVFRISYGLGLQIISKLVHCMNGSLKLDSKPETGTRFEITIPCIEAARLGNNSNDEKPQAQPGNSLAGSNLLIVDDSELNRRLISVMLREYHFNTTEAEDGIEALEIIKNTKPELILMDLYMPNLDGYASLRELKNNKSTCSIPVIAVTASASEEEKNNVYAAGFDAYVTKPVDKALLLKEIRRLIKKKAGINS